MKLVTLRWVAETVESIWERHFSNYALHNYGFWEHENTTHF